MEEVGPLCYKGSFRHDAQGNDCLSQVEVSPDMSLKLVELEDGHPFILSPGAMAFA